tara:strand:- start:7520 stop:13813 length:6294 start_codon:yes stop_codon:yes gene_type:complete
MKARMPFRSLFTTTSIAALLVASSGAYAAGTTINSGPLSTPITADTDFVSIETTLTNNEGIDGLVISGGGTDVGTVTNTSGAVIDVSDSAEELADGYSGNLHGILITDGAEAYNGIYNDGTILVEAQDVGLNAQDRGAWGIRVEDGAYAPSFDNSGLIDVEAVSRNIDDSGMQSDQELDATARAFGIESNGVNYGFHNSGSILVDATGQTLNVTSDDAGGGDADSMSLVYADAYAAGASFYNDGTGVDEDYNLTSVAGDMVIDGGAITVNANATGTANANAEAYAEVSCTISESGCAAAGSSLADAYGYVAATAYGIRAEGNHARTGLFLNNGDISVTAAGHMNSVATATSEDDAAIARAGAHRDYYDIDEDYYYTYANEIDATAVGVWLDAMKIDGDVENHGDIAVEAVVYGMAVAQASGTRDASAEIGFDARADAKGVDIDTMLLDGGFINDGRIEALSALRLYNASGDPYEPILASAHSADESSASIELYGRSTATGVEIDAHSMTGNFYASGENEDDGIFASALITSVASASAYATAEGSFSDESWANSLVAAEFTAQAIGINVAIDSLAGQFVNEGFVGSDALINAHHVARSYGLDESTAYADATITARATGIRFGREEEGDSGSISGNFINRGDVFVSSTVHSTSEAYAEGRGDLQSAAGAEVYASATGIYLDAGYVEDNFRSEGYVNVAIQAQAKLVANSTVDDESDGYAFATAGGFEGPEAGVYVNGTGLDLFISEISGYIYNSAQIDVDVSATQTSIVTANGGDYGAAVAFAGGVVRAESSGIYLELESAGTGLEWVDDEEMGDGSFANTGVINSNAGARIVQTVHAAADDGYALAVAEVYGSESFEDDDADAFAYGIRIEAYEETAYFAGSAINTGNVIATSRLSADIEARATVDEGDEEDTAAGAMAGGYFSAGAEGFHIEDAEIDGEFLNDADIAGRAYVETDVSAYANSDDSPAIAIIGSHFYPVDEFSFEPDAVSYLVSGGIGLQIIDTYIGDGLTNTGWIGGQAISSGVAKAQARGDEYARASVNEAAAAFAIGISADEISLGDTFLNAGVVHGYAMADHHSTATATGDDATAAIGEFGSYGSRTEANATGIYISADSSFSFINQYDGEDAPDSEDSDGVIYAGATAYSTNYAHAEATDEAHAEVSHSDRANATGVRVYYSTEEYSGFVFNSGLIYAEAYAGAAESGGQEAYAESGDGEATAYVEHDVRANATGGDITANEFINTGLIVARAQADSSAYAHAESDEEDAEATANAWATAEATGLFLRGAYPDSIFSNAGLISGHALATAYARADADGEDDYYTSTEASAYAYAIGLNVSDGSYFDTLTNELDGVIEAHATAEGGASENEESSDGHARAYAIGLHGDVLTFVTLLNDGTINATASAQEYAYARGIELSNVNDASYSGEIVNTGTISASATSDNPYATAILLDGNAYVHSIRNTGTISATVFDYDEDTYDGEDGHAIAIDIRGAAQGVTIEQLDGSIVGDVRMENALSDYLDWSGGTISGDIYGDQEDDHLNIFAGEDASFVYHGTVDGLDRFSINGGDYDDDILVRLTNTVRNVNMFNVGPNATLNLGKFAEITTGDLNLDASSMLVFDLTSDGVNGVINTVTADLGGATVKANFISPWLPDSQVYRIINWEGDSETRFGSVISSSLLEKVIAQYGEDGVDLLATRLKFADLTGLEDDATSFGRALDRIFDDIDPDSELGQAIMLLIQLTPDQFAYEMSQIAGQQIADVQHVTLSQLGSLIHVIQTQINEARTNLTSNAGADGVKVSFGSDKLRVSSGDDMPDIAGVSAGDETVKGDWSAWARVFGDWSKLDGSGTAQGFTSTTGGAVIGADYAVSDALTLGLAGGYQASNLEFGTGGEGDVDGWSVTAYGDYRFGNAYIDVLVGYAVQSYDMDRYLTVLGVNYIANSTYDGSAIIGAVEAGYTFTVAPATTLTPFIGVNGNQTKTDASVETGAGIWNLAYEDRSETQIDTVLGVRISKAFTGSDGLAITPTFELGWKHGFGNSAPTANASLAGTPGTQFQIFGSPTSRDTAIVGAALQVQMSNKIDLYLQYNGQYSSDYADNAASLRLHWKF